ncbi:hypothetical protein TRSC58_02975, partial [Trypanosoma rangeli SC58]
MPRLCLRYTRGAPLCRLTANAMGAVDVAAVAPRRYRSANERESIDNDPSDTAEGTHHHRRGFTAAPDCAGDAPPQRLQVGAAKAGRYPQVRVALHPHAMEEPETHLDEEPHRRGATASSTGSVALTAAEGQAENEVQAFLREKRREVEEGHLERNAALPYPTHPDDMVPEFRRIKRHQAIVVVATDPDYPAFARQDQFVRLPPPENHPWVKNTPIGPFVVHGDGQLGVVGSGEVGFDDGHAATALPRSFRGLRHRSVLQQRLPQKNGKVIQDVVVKNSFTLTGRGVFATRDIVAGETIMIVRSTASNLGVKGE